jgi:hypothetical protein
VPEKVIPPEWDGWKVSWNASCCEKSYIVYHEKTGFASCSARGFLLTYPEKIL